MSSKTLYIAYDGPALASHEMDVRELEELVLSVMKNELQTVVNLGAVIGAIIGAVNIFI